jgi:hypothetical protein
MASSPHWKLRRIADRVLRVHARKSPTSPALAAYDETLPPKVKAFIAAYDAARASEAAWRRDMAEGRGAVAALVKRMRAWLPSFTRDVPGFQAGDFADRPDVPDDVLGDATRLFDAIDASVPPAAPVKWAASFEADLTPLFQSAVSEWHEAEAADATYQGLLRAVREAAAAFDAELQLYRVSLAAVVGPRDKDFQKLRAERAGQRDEEDAAPLPGGDGAGGPVQPGDPPVG